ncbi:hypothetical protein GCM10010329_03890 [Streptomyces spiroverticillatus]|uniref:histidine kinase n=1 Tax=Streptomyces finlayi TaxID=67296 RepID=A0A918WSQ0_9ACTN|nr:HAMP domain-containing sensor histidine kinase [Streptomyces finlayi]GGZ87191.1 hypothetical protein GCM10010329_03890 [Streptomyces spiroverticillatus]GHC78505.1 hypothetical protein GCM10010334_03870 [Streptomyces finlayi]
MGEGRGGSEVRAGGPLAGAGGSLAGAAVSASRPAPGARPRTPSGRPRIPSARPRLRVAVVGGGAAALVNALLVTAWLVAYEVAPSDDPFGRLRPFVDGLPWYGVTGGTLLVVLAVRGVARRWGVACVVGGVAGMVLWAHAIWANHLNSAEPWATPDAARDAGFGFAVPVTAVVVGFTGWVVAEPLGRLVPWRGRRQWWVPAALGAVAAGAGVVWGFVQPWSALPSSDSGNTLWLLLTCGTLLLVLTGWAAARLTLRPVEAMRAELADITGRSLDRRVPVPAIGGVLQKLARTLNATLDRLQTAADRQARFVADASHELRSPIASLRASLESSLTHSEGVDWPHTVRGTLADIARIQHLTDDLLLLTRIDGPAPNGEEPVQLADLASDLVEEIRHLHRNSDLRVTCTAPTSGLPPLTGSPVRLERLLRNLIDNACRHARTEVEVVLSRGDRGTVRVEVRDDGPGIPPADRDRIFQRFTRLDDSRTRADGGGAGLGLAIAREIAVRHGGALFVADEGPGAVLVAELPLVRPDWADLGEPPEAESDVKSHASKASWVVAAASLAAVGLLAAALAVTVLGGGVKDPSGNPLPSQMAAEPDIPPPAGSVWAGEWGVVVHLYPPVRTDKEGWARLAKMRREWPHAALPGGGTVRTPGARLPYRNDRTVFVAVHRSEPDNAVFASGELPAPGGGRTHTAVTAVPSSEGGELVLGWAPPTVGALAYRWSDGTVKWPELQRVPGSDRRWFLTQGPPGAKSQGCDVYDLADRRTVGEP